MPQKFTSWQISAGRHSYFWKLNLLSFEDKMLIENLWECKRFSARRLIREFSNKIWKRKLVNFLRKLKNIWSNAVQEVVGLGCLKLQITLSKSKNLFRVGKKWLRIHLSTRQISWELILPWTIVIPQVQSFIISYFGFRFTNVYN